MMGEGEESKARSNLISHTLHSKSLLADAGLGRSGMCVSTRPHDSCSPARGR